MSGDKIRLKISELFVSLQGEGPAAGYPAFFVRLSGCNLSCRWCDTPHARQPKTGQEMEIPKIVNHFRKSGVSQVLITGGEPLLQEGVYALMEEFLALGAQVFLETNGSLSLKRVPSEVTKVMDLKPPSSGMSKYMLYENLRYLSHRDQIKFVIADEEDYRWAKEKVLRLGLNYFTEVSFSPAWGLMSPEKLAKMILRDRLPVRLQPQLHKILKLP
ncbi:MAG TPA: radical SAM protein [Thermodesulfobacteriaceae bacterium]|nr:radical SAM protein [Thermodesulfobacteriaceae bacterium]